jgi:hypothetical protein
MTSKKSGFAGLGNLVSDISEVTSQQEPVKEAPAPTTAKPRETSTPPQSQSNAQSSGHQATPALQTSNQTSANTNQPSGGSSGMGWLIGIGFLVFFVIVVSSGGNKSNQPSSSPSYSAAPSKPALSEYEQAIPSLDPQVEKLIFGMLTAFQSNDLQLAASNALTIEKLAKASAQGSKPQVKEARAQNALGLKALKEQRKEAAVQHFFTAYKANPRDTEIANNFGEALYEIGDYAAAKKAYLTSLALTPKRSFAWVSMGRLIAREHDIAKASSVFGLAFQYAKSPRQMRQSVVTLFRDDDNYDVKNAAKSFLVQSYSSAVPEFLRPVLANLADVKITVFLPAKVMAHDSDGKIMSVYAVNNEMYGIEVTPDSYSIPFASESDCRASFCSIGVLSGRRVSAADIPEDGEPVGITGGIIGNTIRDNYKNTSRFVFRVADIEYTFALSADSTDDVASANSALMLGSIPVDAFAGETKLASTTPAPIQQAYVPPQTTYTPPAPAYTPPPTRNAWECNIGYSVSLQTFGEGVSVELRQGTPGNSRPISTSYSSGGTVRFSSLCPGNYFLAIGNGESVSVTPVRSFDTGIDYSSTLTMQRGTGNVTSRRKGDL